MSIIYLEFHFPFSIIAVIMGYQLSYYFISNFLKTKDHGIGLNKMLIAYGLFFGLSFTGMLIRSLLTYVFPNYNQIIFEKIVILLLILAILSFLGIISSESFQQIISTLYSRLLFILQFIPLISLFIIDTISIGFLFLMFFVLIGLFYIIFFQYRLLSLVTGKVKKRLRYILLGQILIAGAVLTGSSGMRDIFYQEIEVLAIIVSMPLILSGLLLIYLGIFKFPTFLEFNWKEHIIKLMIINQNNQNQIYTFNFNEFLNKPKQEEMKDPLREEKEGLMPSAIIGTGSIISSVIEAKATKTTKIRKGDLSILLSYGNKAPFLLFALIVQKEMKSYQYLLKVIKNQFEGFFNEILDEYNYIKTKEDQLFSSFDVIMKSLMK